MRLQDYKKFITADFVNNTRRGFVDWRDCGDLCMDVIEGLEGAKEGLCAENRYADLFDLCNWTYVKWSNTDKDDSNGETQDFCACVYDIWETVYTEGEQSLSHKQMLDILLEHLDGRAFDYMEDEIYDFILKHFKSEDELVKKKQFLLKVMDDLRRQISEKEILQYSLHVKEEYYVRVLADQKRPIQEIREFLQSRDRYTNKELLAQIETEYGNYDEAIRLYREQIDSRPDSYWSDGPRKALMEIYRIQGDTAAYNVELYNMMTAHTGVEKYYMEYKALFTAEEWKVRWEELLDEFADSQARISKNRRDYKYIARTLKKIAAHPGGRVLAAELAAKHRAQYPRRTAMIDELKRF